METTNFFKNNTKDYCMVLAGVISPEFLNEINDDILNYICEKISNIISNHEKTMIQYTPNQLKEYIKNKQSLIMWDFKSNDLIGFIKYFYHDGVNENNQKVIEIGSLIVNTPYKKCGYAKQLIKYFTKYLKENLNNTQFMIGIEQSNNISNKLFESMGAEKINKPNNVKQIKVDEKINFYDIKNII